MSAAAALPILMCPPTHFAVQYVINPWMEGNVGLASQPVAQKQWDALHRLLSDRTQVQLIPPAPHLPDMCFAANAGLVLENRFVPSVFRVPQRAPETAHFEKWFEANHYELHPLSDALSFEGEGDALFHPDEALLWAGYGVRSSLAAHEPLTRTFHAPVLSLRLIDQRFYHLDTCFAPLPDGRIMYYPAAFDARSQRLIQSRIQAENRIEVDDEDALGFCCNVVRLDRTLIMNQASDKLKKNLNSWGYEVLTTDLSEFIRAGGAAKCLCLLLKQQVPGTIEQRPPVNSPIRDGRIELSGHLLDSGVMNRALDTIMDCGGSFRIEQFQAGLRHDQPSLARIRIHTPEQETLDQLMNDLQGLGASLLTTVHNAHLQQAPANGVAPEGFYATTLYPTDVRIDGHWVRCSGQRMDAVIVVKPGASPAQARCTLIRDLQAGDPVICGVEGVAVHAPEPAHSSEAFSFMSAGVSSERRVERVVEELAWEMKRIRARGGRMVVVAGPVVIHTGGSEHLSELIRCGFVQALLTGNALPVHDIELNLFGTSLGVDLKRGTGVPHGHQHHLRAINRIRAAGSIRTAVEKGMVTGGIMYECVKHNVLYVLAGSIRDDGPLPETLMDLTQAQAAYAQAIEGADMILMLSSMLHAIGTGNMTPAGVRLVCVDINPSVVTKLADRGSVEATGLVTDVGLFLNLLVRRLKETGEN